MGFVSGIQRPKLHASSWARAFDKRPSSWGVRHASVSCPRGGAEERLRGLLECPGASRRVAPGWLLRLGMVCPGPSNLGGCPWPGGPSLAHAHDRGTLMKSLKLLWVAFAVMFALGCGGAATEVVGEEALSESSQELATCYANCANGPISCSGTPCQAVDYSGVTCSGVFHACPPTNPPDPTCAYAPCSSVTSQQCWGGESVLCCNSAGGKSQCTCLGGWSCVDVDW